MATGTSPFTKKCWCHAAQRLRHIGGGFRGTKTRQKGAPMTCPRTRMGTSWFPRQGWGKRGPLLSMARRDRAQVCSGSGPNLGTGLGSTMLPSLAVPGGSTFEQLGPKATWGETKQLARPNGGVVRLSKPGWELVHGNSGVFLETEGAVQPSQRRGFPTSLGCFPLPASGLGAPQGKEHDFRQWNLSKCGERGSCGPLSHPLTHPPSPRAEPGGRWRRVVSASCPAGFSSRPRRL